MTEKKERRADKGERTVIDRGERKQYNRWDRKERIACAVNRHPLTENSLF